MRHAPQQLGFESLLASAEEANRVHSGERSAAHLPGTMEEAVPFFRELIDRHHTAMVAGDLETAMHLREEAHRLALKLNNFEPGILADYDAPGCVLDRATRTRIGTVPLWGQSGAFEIAYNGMRVLIDMQGLFGIGATSMAWLGFAAHAVEWDKPFLSETGYRSFLGAGRTLQPGFTPDTFAAAILTAHVRGALKGKLLVINPEHRARAEPAT
jgi:hypothetical protein